MGTLESTGERYLPWMNDPATAYEHWHRYAFVSKYVSGKKVLDLACGEGYGSALLARKARLLVGIDIDEKTVRHALRKYPSDNAQFIVGSVAEIPIAGIQFDVIVCFETIEHILEHKKLLGEAKRLLAPGGFFIASTPNKPEYQKIEPSNHFHVNELDLEEFTGLLSKYFPHLHLLGQRIYANSCLWSLSHGGSGPISEFLIDHNSEEYFYTETDSRNPLYFIAIASDTNAAPPFSGAVLIDCSNSLLKDKDRIQREQRETMQSQKEALTWRESVIRSQQKALTWRERVIQEQETALQSRQRALTWREEQVVELQAMVGSRNEALAWRESQLDQQRKETHYLADQLRILQSGRAWRIIQRFLRMRDRLLPENSMQRTIYDRILDRIKPRQGITE